MKLDGFEREDKVYRDYVAGLPPHLAAFAEPQHYHRYTPENHAVWRFIMRQLSSFFQTKAPESYQKGLDRASITIDRIPRIEEMVKSLQEIGWGAICVNGFIPPVAFMEYNANKILPISADMRTIQHLLYTPAPDIVHEAAGHAAIVADSEYTDFLQKVGEYGAKALSHEYDRSVYEAIRKLSIVKEHPRSTKGEIEKAQRELDQSICDRRKCPPSEAALISRFHWWTVEYGLLKRPQEEEIRLFGAGLLSSLGESRNCFDDRKVKKIKLDLSCLEKDYDITTEQPQLYYVESSKDLFPVLEELADQMAFRMGGTKSLHRAIECGCTATVVYDSGLQVSGVWSQCLKDGRGEGIYLATKGPTSLSYGNVELEGHGGNYHSQGFSSPLGKVKGLDRPLSHLNYRELESAGIVRGEKSTLEFESGIFVEGTLKDIVSREGKNILMTFSDCRVLDPKGELLFDPEWGMYDMAVGDEITSVFGGPADKRNYDFIKQKSEETLPEISYTSEEKNTFELYTRLRQVREGKADLEQLKAIYGEIQNAQPRWLLLIEIVEIIKRDFGSTPERASDLETQVLADLEKSKKEDPSLAPLIEMGLDLAAKG